MTELYKHQVVGVDWITRKPYMMLADEPGAGKTLQVIEAAQRMYEAGDIDQVVVVCPPEVRSVWYDREFGQVKQFARVPLEMTQYHSKVRTWTDAEQGGRAMRWTVTNYEFLRHGSVWSRGKSTGPRLDPLVGAVGEKTLLVLDESFYVKNPEAEQTRAVWTLRQGCGRVVELNGTPDGDNPGDVYAQMKILHPDILGCRDWFQYRGRYALMATANYRGRNVKEIVGWKDLDDLKRRCEPYVLRRLKRECIDLPPVLPPVVLTAAMTPATWRLYKEMRDEAVAWLTDNETAAAPQAGAQVMRLAQITSGFLGGVECSTCRGIGELSDGPCPTCEGLGVDKRAREVGKEKLELLVTHLRGAFEEEPDLKSVVWCRFRPEVERTVARLRQEFPRATVEPLYGSQHRDERDRAKALLNPRSAKPGPAIIVGTVRTGGVGLDLQAAWRQIFASNDYSQMVRTQAEGRLDRPGQTKPISTVDLVLTGPDGQQTVDHAVLRALRDKQSTNLWRAKDWLEALSE